MPVSRVTIHHRGGGAPANGPWGGSEPYSILIGITENTVQQPPETSWATAGYNHVSYDVCLSGNRNIQPISDGDLKLLHDAYTLGVERGWIVPNPIVYPHGTINKPPPPYPTGSSPTECPGTLTIARWPQVVNAFSGSTQPVPGDDDMPADKDFVDAFSNSEGSWKLQYDGGVETVRGPFYGSYFTLDPSVRNDPTRRFLTICAALNGLRGYSLVSVKAGEVYSFNTPR